MLQEFLVAYDYGMGGLWAIVLAESAADITALYPELVIVDKPPPWMDDAEFAKVRRDPLSLDSRSSEGMLKAIGARTICARDRRLRRERRACNRRCRDFRGTPRPLATSNVREDGIARDSWSGRGRLRIDSAVWLIGAIAC